MAQLEQWRVEMESGQLVVLMLDECHLLWGDVCGYVWGKTNERTVVPMLSRAATPNLLWGIELLHKRILCSGL